MRTYAFELRIRLYDPALQPSPICTIFAYDDNARPQDSHNRVDIEVYHDGAVVFPRGQLYVGVPNCHPTDGIYAKEAVLSCVAMAPGDTDADYFASYTRGQLAWVAAHKDALTTERESRYCDKNGGVRRGRS